jgi:uncharacterized protein YjbI with pentapeptide repeats
MDVWRHKLVLKWLFFLRLCFCAICSLFVVDAIADSDQASSGLVTGLSHESLQAVLDEHRWDIIDNRIRGHDVVATEDVLQKSYIDRTKQVRLAHRDIRVLLDYQKVKFLAPVNFLQSHFFVSPIMTLSEFAVDADFSSTHFDYPVGFEWSIFRRASLFPYARFDGGVSFYGSLFSQKADFYRSQFNSVTNFSSAHFLHHGNFSHVNFKDDVLFSKTHWNDDVSFSYAVFSKDGIFAGSRMQGEVDMRGALFAHRLDFSRAEFGGTVIFSGMVLPKYLDLSHVVKISQGLDLTGVKENFSSKCLINLVGADISKIKFRYGPFKLYFPDGSTHEDKVAVYEAVLKMLEQNGYMESYREVMIEYKRYSYRHKGLWATNLVQDYAWDYGFDPERIFYWILITVLFFTSVNALFYRKLVEKVMDVPFLSQHAHSQFIERNFALRYIFYFPVTFIYTVMILFSHLLGFKRDFTDFKSRSIWVNAYMMILLLVGISCSLLVLNYLIGG